MDSCERKILLTLSQTTNFRLFQTERVCRWQFQIWWKWKKVLQTGRKHCGDFSFSHSVFKRLVLQTHKNQGLFGKGLNWPSLIFRKYTSQARTQSIYSYKSEGVQHGLLVKCLTHNPGVLGSSGIWSSGFFHGSVLGQDTSEPQPSTGETQERCE